MRLWHQLLIRYLPKQQLLGQHRETSALRGGSFGKKHSVVDYAWRYHPYALYSYHMTVIEEMENRGYNVNQQWKDPCYRGKNMERWPTSLFDGQTKFNYDCYTTTAYKEHDSKYWDECCDLLENRSNFRRPIKPECLFPGNLF